MENISSAAKNIIRGVLVLFFLIMAAGLAFYRGDMEGFQSFALGLLLGSGLSCILVLMMEHSIKQKLESAEAGSKRVNIGYFTRHILVAAVVLAAIFMEPINHWGTVAGLASLKLAAYRIRFSFLKKQ